MAQFSFKHLYDLKRVHADKEQSPGRITKAFFSAAHEMFINVGVLILADESREKHGYDIHFQSAYQKAVGSFKDRIIPSVNNLPSKAFLNMDIIIKDSGIVEEMEGFEAMLREEAGGTNLESRPKPEIVMPKKKLSKKTKEKTEVITDSIKKVLENLMSSLKESKWIPQWVVDLVKSIFEVIDEFIKLAL